MVLIEFKPGLAELLISQRESEKQLRDESLQYLEGEIQRGGWNDVNPIWITPNFILNGIFRGLGGYALGPTLKPFIMYNGHNRLNVAIKHNLSIKAYVRYTPGNPPIPEEERLTHDLHY